MAEKKSDLEQLKGILKQFGADTILDAISQLGVEREQAEPSNNEIMQSLIFGELEKLNETSNEVLGIFSGVLGSRATLPDGLLQRGKEESEKIELGCGVDTTVSGKGEKIEKESSVDLGCNEQVAKEKEAKDSAETAAKESALAKAKSQAGKLECEDGCEPDIDDNSPVYTLIVSRRTGATDQVKVPSLVPKIGGTVLSCRWGWEAQFKAKIKFKCVTTGG